MSSLIAGGGDEWRLHEYGHSIVRPLVTLEVVTAVHCLRRQTGGEFATYSCCLHRAMKHRWRFAATLPVALFQVSNCWSKSSCNPLRLAMWVLCDPATLLLRFCVLAHFDEFLLQAPMKERGNILCWIADAFDSFKYGLDSFRVWLRLVLSTVWLGLASSDEKTSENRTQNSTLTPP